MQPLFFIILLFSITSGAQQLLLKNYQIKDGLPSAEMYCVFQDSKGYIWFGSDAGVSRFDGYTFKNYSTEDGLADNVVFGILEDRHGRIWFRSLSGKLSYYENDSIHSIAANDFIAEQMKNAIMNSFYMDSGDTLWCSLQNGNGIFKISPGYALKNIENIRLEQGHWLMEVEKENFISGTVFRYGKKKNSCISFYKKQTLQRQVQVPDLSPSHVLYIKLAPDKFLVADAEKVFSIEKEKVQHLLSPKRIFNVQTVMLRKEGNYTWLGLMRKGVLRYGKNDLQLARKNLQILDGYSVSDVKVDQEGGTWFSTLENGIYYASPQSFTFYQNNNGHSAYYSHTIEKLGSDHILISSKPDKVDIVSSDTILKNKKITDPLIKELLGRPPVSSALILTGNVFVQDSFATYIWRKNEMHLTEVKKSIPGKDLWIRFYTHDSLLKTTYLLDRFWLYRMEDQGDSIRSLIPLPSRTLSLFQDRKGTIWLGCLNGLWSFDKGKFNYHGNENELLKNAIEDIKQDKYGSIYYATRGNGVIVLKDGIYSKITTANGLISNNCKCLFVEGNDSIWVGSKNGLCRLRKGAAGWRALKLDLNGNESNFEIFQIEKTANTLWLFCNKGLLSYPLTEVTDLCPPRIYISTFSVNEVFHNKDGVRIFNHTQNFVKVEYCGLSFQSLGKLTYSYRLLGLDTAWHRTSGTSLQYSFLPPGNYTFSVKALSFNGAESAAPASFSFTIKKPFWKTLWFISMIFLLATGGTFLLFTYRIKAFRKQEAAKTIFNKQLANLEMKALRSQMNPHFIFNAINSIQNYIVKKDSRAAQDYLAKFARLIRNVLENSRQETISLNKELDALGLYIELEQMRSPGKFTYNLTIQPGLPLNDLSIPPLILQPYVENAILHGLTTLKQNTGQLNISLEKKDTKLICIIDDNGIGRKKSAELKQEKQIVHHSIGLSVTEDRIRMSDELHDAESSITITDKFSSEGEAVGTIVTIVLSMSKEAQNT